MEKVIIDSDWGGDVLQLASVLLSRPDEYEVLGATVVFGNATLGQNLENAGSILRLLGAERTVPRFAGAAVPDGCELQPDGDNAHGRTGLGDIVLEPAETPAETRDAVSFFIDTLTKYEKAEVTLVATGPLTNVAKAIRMAPQAMSRLKEIRIMGGCLNPITGYRVDAELKRLECGPIERKGNITEWAEFNFQQAPEDAKTVLESGILLSVFPMDCTHQLAFTKERELRLGSVLEDAERVVKILAGLCRAPESMDQAKFGNSAIMHDVNTTVSMLRPDLYTGRRGRVGITTQGERAGETCFESDESGPHWVAERIRDPDAVFEVLLDSWKRLFG